MDAIVKAFAATDADKGVHYRAIWKADDYKDKPPDVTNQTITTERRDRYGDIVRAKGMRWEDWARNPMIYLSHGFAGHPLPMVGQGRALHTIKTKGGLKGVAADWTWATSTQLARDVRGLWEENILRACSISFLPDEKQIVYMDDEGKPVDDPWDATGMDFKVWDMLENSVVGVPANADAAKAVMRMCSAETRQLLDVEALAKGRTIFDLGKDARDRLLQRAADDRLCGELEAAQTKGAISYNAAHSGGTPKAAEDAPWNGPSEVAAADISDLKVMCAWQATPGDNGPVKGDFKLPHHQAAGQHAVVLRGVQAAMGALLGARGGVNIPDGDRRGCYNHLSRHYRDFDMEPPEFREADEDKAAETWTTSPLIFDGTKAYTITVPVATPEQTAPTPHDVSKMLRDTIARECPECGRVVAYHQPSGEFVAHQNDDRTCTGKASPLKGRDAVSLYQLLRSIDDAHNPSTVALREKMIATRQIKLPLESCIRQLQARVAQLTGHLAGLDAPVESDVSRLLGEAAEQMAALRATFATETDTPDDSGDREQDAPTPEDADAERLRQLIEGSLVPTLGKLVAQLQ